MTLTEELQSRLGEPRRSVRDTYHFGMSSGVDSQLFRLPARSGVDTSVPVSVYVGTEMWNVIQYAAGSRANLTAEMSASFFQYPTNVNDFLQVRVSKGTTLVDGAVFVDVIDAFTAVSVTSSGGVSVNITTSGTEAVIAEAVSMALAGVLLPAYTMVYTPGDAFFRVRRVATGELGDFSFTSINTGLSGITFSSFMVRADSSSFGILISSDGTSIMAADLAQQVFCQVTTGSYVVDAIIAQVVLKAAWQLRKVDDTLVVENLTYTNSTSSLLITIINTANTSTTHSAEFGACTVVGAFDVEVYYGATLVETLNVITTGLESGADLATTIAAGLVSTEYVATTDAEVVTLTATEFGFDEAYSIVLANNTTDVTIVDSTNTVGTESVNVSVISSELILGIDSVTLFNYGPDDKVVQLNYSNGALLFGNNVNGLVPNANTPLYISYTELFSAFNEDQLNVCLINAYKDLVLKVPLTFTVDLATEEFVFSTNEASERALLMASAVYNITKEAISLGDYYYFKQQHRVVDTTKTGTTHIMYLKEIIKEDLSRSIRAFRNRKQRAVAITLGEI